MDKIYKIVSGFISVGLYLLIVIMLIRYADTKKYTIKTTNKQQKEITVDLTSIITKQDTKSHKEQLHKKVKKQKKSIATKSKKTTKDIKDYSVKSLFDEINTTDELFIEKRVKQKIDKIDINQIYKPKITRKKIKISNKLKSELKNTKINLVLQSDKGIEDKEFDKIIEFFSSGWYPSPREKGMYAIVSVVIKKDGSFKYFIKSTNGDELFVDKLTTHIKKLQKKGINIKKYLSIKIQFKAESFSRGEEVRK